MKKTVFVLFFHFVCFYFLLFREFSIFYCFSSFHVAHMYLLLNHLGTERLLVVRCPRPLLLEEVNGERDFGARSSSSAEVSVAGLNQLAICPVVPWRVLLEQSAELVQRASQPLAGVGGTDLFLVPCGVMQVAALVVVQKEDVADMACACRAESESFGAPDGGALAAGEERVVDSLVGLGLRGGLDRTSLQLSQGDGDAFDGHEGLRIDGLGDCLVGLEGLKGLDELGGGSSLDGLHGGRGELGGTSILLLFPNSSSSNAKIFNFYFENIASWHAVFYELLFDEEEIHKKRGFPLSFLSISIF